ncbi:LysR family transcriptional regulator [Pacificibacter maritimus]|uniref:LysR family transcriptional regulator n=1 Tax=Pacificibacter maritimus TaxID=762213 RepID=A0A3N4V4V0_9RHOB|nr:LysR family transcriptional regulator [Pacificibacter maritimus]RPE72137.1 LysR family transcriptional regulator [Pacificibacter maritimus]
MRFKKLDLNLLVALDHMIELRSVSAAADKMFMSQSAMSNALTRLRDYFDDPLLVQVGRRMEVTPRAESMRLAIRDILVRIEATIDSQPEFRPEESTRTFNLLLSDYSLRVLMPTVFRLIDSQSSTIKLNLRAQTELPQVLLERGEIDLLISPEMFISDDHPASLLYQDNYVVAAWAGGKYGNVTMDQKMYETASHAVMVPPNAAKSYESALLALAGIERQIDVKTFSFTNLPHLITGTDRVATIHARLAKLVAQQAELVTYPIPADLPPLRQMLQWHAYRENDPGIIWLRGLLEQAVAELD